MDWQIKRFDELSTEELYEILKARYEVFTVGQRCLYQDCDNIDKQSYHMFLREGERVVAYLRIVKPGVVYGEASIGRVMVVESHRKKGFARDMMKCAMDFIKNEMKQTKIKLSAQEYLWKFYESLGFKIVSDVYLEVEIPHVKMEYEDILSIRRI